MSGAGSAPRIVVVGAGVLGASVAWHLARRGASPTVVEAGRPGHGTSGASFAWVNAQDKQPAGYFALNAEGVVAYPALAAALGDDWYHPGGDLIVAIGEAVAPLDERIARHRALDYPVRRLDRPAVAALEPDLVPPAGDLVAAHFETEAWIDAPVFVERLLGAALAAGARTVRGTVVGFETAGGRVTAVRTADGDRVAADIVVLAAGPATERLAATLGVTVPMAPTPGLLAVTAPTTVRIAHVVHTGDVAIRGAGAGRLMLSSRELDASLDPDIRALDPDAEPATELLARARRVIPALRDTEIAVARIGVRSISTDGLPVTGFAPDVEGCYVLVSHSGVTLAPVLGRLVADEVLGGAAPALAPYRPLRFQRPSAPV